jgi:hypothetical protein
LGLLAFRFAHDHSPLVFERGDPSGQARTSGTRRG